MTKMIRAIIFDLDNCLSAADEPGKGLLEPVLDAIRRANHGRLSDEALAEAFADCWRHPLDFVAKKHGFPEDMLAAGWAMCARLEVDTVILQPRLVRESCGAPALTSPARIDTRHEPNE